MRKKLRYILSLTAAIIFMAFQPAWADGPPPPSIFSNALAVTLIVLMLLLLIIIGILANILIGTADYKVKEEKKSGTGKIVASSILMFLSLTAGSSLFAQDANSTSLSQEAASTIGGMTASTFYIMASVIFLELLVIIVLLINIKFLLRREQEKQIPEVVTEVVKKNKLSWWDKFNKLKPVSQEAELDLGHEYDGIRELNNRLPPWWLYGFYLTIIFAFVYLWRFHVSHNGPSSKEEYETSVTEAEIRIQEYLKKKGENVDENTVILLTDPSDIAAGKAIFTNSQYCMTCHREDGGGNIGPNLTDDYWIYGGSIKDVFRTVKYGTAKGMKSWKDDLSAKQIAQVSSYVKSLHGTNPPNPKEHQGELYKDEEVTAPATDSLKTPVDSISVKENKVAMN
jgi:cytochrome c oxidase cbb3-type subunit III